MTFSNAAADEAKERIETKHGALTGVDKERFRTIHSLCAQLCGIGRRRVIVTKDYQEVMMRAKLSAIKSYRGHVQDDGDKGSARFIKQYDLERLSNSAITMNAYVEAFEEYKAETGKVDFTDMLIRGREALRSSEVNYRIDCLLADECQDLCPLQWDILELLIAKSDEVHLAGDDDQEIYGFAGADSSKMVEYARSEDWNVVELVMSHRVPEMVAIAADKVIKHVKSRAKKQNLIPKAKRGHVHKLWSLNTIPKLVSGSTGTWLVLGRTRHIVKRMETELASKLPKDRVLFKTIHASKGSEADNVVLNLEITPMVGFKMNLDKERKLFYVGATRAKDSLYLLSGTRRNFNI